MQPDDFLPMSDLPIDGDGGTAPLEALKRERDELNQRLLRTAADFDNYRKRNERERREWSDSAVADLLRDVLPAMDDLERALAMSSGNDQSDAAAASLRKGIELIHGKLLDALKKRGVEPIAALGTDFDPNLHEAVVSESAPGRRDGEVLAELQRGYRLRDRLIRPAMVKVAKA